MFISPKNKYLYSQFVFNQDIFVLWISFYFLAMVVLLFILLICKNSTVAKVVVLLPITLVVWWGSTIFCGLVVDNFWKSETVTFEEFYEVDIALEREVKIAGLSIGELTQCDVESVEGFEYNYQTYLLHSTFKLKGKIVYSEERYNLIKQAFLSDEEFVEVKYYDGENNEYNMTGYFEFESKLPAYQTNTSVDEWDKLIVCFNDETHSFYFDLSGDYDT